MRDAEGQLLFLSAPCGALVNECIPASFIVKIVENCFSMDTMILCIPEQSS